MIESSNLNKKKTIYWIRHAESFSNTSEGGWQIIDPGLTELGIVQCETLKKHISSEKILDNVDLILVSPLSRTLETCVKVFDDCFYKIPILSIEEIREQMDKPCHKRKNISEKKNKFKPIDFSKLDDYDKEFDKYNGSESKTNVIKRCKKFIAWLKNQKQTNIIVITHGNFLYPMFNEILEDINNNKTFFSNCEIRKTFL
jgi:broad specificity phosphatase PhoE